MTERDEELRGGLAELMNPEVARNPQPIYSMLQTSSPVFRLDGVGVIVTHASGRRPGAPRPDAVLVEHVGARHQDRSGR